MSKRFALVLRIFSSSRKCDRGTHFHDHQMHFHLGKALSLPKSLSRTRIV